MRIDGDWVANRLIFKLTRWFDGKNLAPTVSRTTTGEDERPVFGRQHALLRIAWGQVKFPRADQQVAKKNIAFNHHAFFVTDRPVCRQTRARLQSQESRHHVAITAKGFALDPIGQRFHLPSFAVTVTAGAPLPGRRALTISPSMVPVCPREVPRR